MPAVVEFRGRGNYLSFALIPFHPHPDYRDYAVASVTVQTNDFRGSYQEGTWLEEWRVLRATLANLDRLVGQDVRFQAGFLELQITLTFELSKRGQLMLYVEIHRQAIPVETYLRFGIEADQSFLPLWIRAIDQALAQLPAE
jgi:hypothetical protein